MELRRPESLNQNETIYLWEVECVGPITLTVGLPIYKGDKIVWLQLTSLKYQKNIDFNWELIIYEEGDKSLEVIESFINDLYQKGCKRIKYVVLENKINLLEKWIKMSKDASDTSKVFVMTGADDYSPSKRLFIHHEHFKNNDCYVSTQKIGLFYNLKTKKKMFYLAKLQHTKELKQANHLHIGIRTSDMRQVKYVELKKGVDGYIFRDIQKRHKLYKGKGIYFYNTIDANNWKTGFDTDGANVISLKRRKLYNNIKKPFVPFTYRKKIGYTWVKDYVPKEVFIFIKKFKY